MQCQEVVFQKKDLVMSMLLAETGNGNFLTAKDFSQRLGLAHQQTSEIISYLVFHEKKYLICSTSQGYFIAKNRAEALSGYGYIETRIKEQQQRVDAFLEKLNKLFPDPDQKQKEPELF